MQLAPGSGALSTQLAGLLCGAGGISLGVAIAGQFAAEGGSVAPQDTGDGAQALALLAQGGKDDALFGLQMRVSCVHLCNLLQG